jgi:hypothetical protein
MQFYYNQYLVKNMNRMHTNCVERNVQDVLDIAIVALLVHAWIGST